MDISVYTNVFFRNFHIERNTKVIDIKKEFPEFRIRFFLDKKNEIDVFSTNLYDNLTLNSVWDKLSYPALYLKPLQNLNKVEGKIPLTNTIPNTIKNTIPKIRIAQQMKGRSYAIVEGFVQIPCWSRGKGDWKQLSPFYLKFNYEGRETIFESFWQSFKVWERVDKQNKPCWKWPAETHISAENPNKPNEKWEKWHDAVMYHNEAIRRPNGKAIPKYSYYNDKCLGLIEARQQIYIPFLKQLYRNNPVYKTLLQKFKNGENLLLIEPDGPFLDVYPQGLEVDLQLLHDLINVTNYANEGYPEKYRAYGHGLCLATCLLEDY